MNILFSIISVITCNIKSFFYFFLNFGRLRLIFPLKSICFPRIRIREGGRIILGRVKFRYNCGLFVDGGTLIIEDDVFINNGCSITVRDKVTIGQKTLLGEGVKIYDHNHIINKDHSVEFYKFSSKEVTIGKNCWLGANVIILPGVHLCDHVIIGAGSVVTKSIDTPGVYVSEYSHLRML